MIHWIWEVTFWELMAGIGTCVRTLYNGTILGKGCSGIYFVGGRLGMFQVIGARKNRRMLDSGLKTELTFVVSYGSKFLASESLTFLQLNAIA